MLPAAPLPLALHDALPISPSVLPDTWLIGPADVTCSAFTFTSCRAVPGVASPPVVSSDTESEVPMSEVQFRHSIILRQLLREMLPAAPLPVDVKSARPLTPAYHSPRSTSTTRTDCPSCSG